MIAFADEEGARFNTPTFGSRALVGRLDVADVLARRTTTASRSPTPCAPSGADPGRLADAPALARAAARVRRAAHRPDARPRAASARPPGAVRALASRMRLALTSTGRADHAGTTRRDERRDALAAAARLIVAADELAGGDPDFLVTAARILVEPNAFTTVPVRGAAVDRRAHADAARLADAGATLARPRARLAGATGVAIELATASHSRGRHVRPRRPRALGGLPELVCFAGHDAGILAAAPARPAWSSSATRPASATRPRRTSTSRTRPSPPARACGALERLAMKPHELPAMVNAHSHAFQRDLRGAAERPAPEAHAADDFWSWREAMYRLAGAHDPASMRDGGRARLRRDGRGRLRRRRRVPLRPPPARRHAVRRAERDGDRGRRGGRRRGPADRAPPRRLPPRGLDGGDRPPTAGQRRFCDPDVGAYLERVDALRAWAAGREASTSASPRTACAPCRRAGSRRSPPTPSSTASSATSTRTSSRASSRSAAAEHGVSPIELLAPHRLPRPADERHPRHPRRRRRRRAGWPRATRSSSPARPPRAASATATSPRSPTATPACGSRSGATRTCASTRSRRRASSRRSPGASAARATRCSPPTATCGPSWRANGRASLGLDGTRARSRSTATTRPRGRRRRRPPARRRDVRVRGRGLVSAASTKQPSGLPLPPAPTLYASVPDMIEALTDTLEIRHPDDRPRPRPRRRRRLRPARDRARVDPAGRPPRGRHRRRDRPAEGVAGLVTPRSGLAIEHGLTLLNAPG